MILAMRRARNHARGVVLDVAADNVTNVYVYDLCAFVCMYAWATRVAGRRWERHWAESFWQSKEETQSRKTVASVGRRTADSSAGHSFLFSTIAESAVASVFFRHRREVAEIHSE